MRTFFILLLSSLSLVAQPQPSGSQGPYGYPLSAVTNTVVALITNAPPNVTNFTAHAAGTAYSLTTTPALVHLGTTDPAITINQAGTYLLITRVRADFNGATFAAARTITYKLRRTNNIAADVTGATTAAIVPVGTTITYTAHTLELAPVIYTATSGDIIQLWGSINTGPTAGSVDIAEADVIALRLY